MALCEAMASGLPVICTEYSSGPREIITNEFDGLLVPSEDVTALATAMDRLMGDAPTRKRFGLNAVAVAERFSIRRVMGLWEEILNDCVLRHGIRTAEMRLACQ
jgi:glycosyltransferase involved in cell wall biosynthesis